MRSASGYQIRMEKTGSITLYYAKTADYEEEAVFQYWLPQMEEQRKAQIQRLKNTGVKVCSLAAGALLRQALQDWMVLSDDRPLKIDYGEAGKPHLAGNAGIHFNLSHSGDYVCCAVSTTPVGVDIQQHVAVKQRIAEHFFTEQDNQRLERQERLTGRGKEWKELFFRMWSIKESYLKLTGNGLSRGLDSFEIDWEKQAVTDRGFTAWFWAQEKFGGYSVCVCSRECGLRIEEKEIKTEIITGK